MPGMLYSGNPAMLFVQYIHYGSHNYERESRSDFAPRAGVQRHMQLRKLCKALDGDGMAMSKQSLERMLSWKRMVLLLVSVRR